MSENENTCQKNPAANSLDSLRKAGCQLVNQYLPGYNPNADSAEVFGITEKQFDRAVDLEIIRHGEARYEYAALHNELERLRGELTMVGLYVDAACYGTKRPDEPASLTKRLDMVRALRQRAFGL